ncbi:MAG: hypothetical protein ACKO7A_10875 [Microcystis sp.]
MKEDDFQAAFLELMASQYPDRVFAPHVQLKYEIGKYSKGKDFTMPDTIPDVIEFDEDKNFHLWELKLITSSEVWNGKFFGQMILYNFLFSTEPWNELVGRFAFSGQKPSFKGEVGKILIHLASYGSGEIAEESDANANFKTWNLCICGGSGYELAAGYNPVAWSFWIIAEEYFKRTMPNFNIWHLFSTQDGFVLRQMTDLSVDEPETLHHQALSAYLALHDNEEK